LFSVNFGRPFNIATTKDGIEALQALKTSLEVNLVISDMKQA